MSNPAVPREQWPEYMARAQAGDQQAYARLLHTLVPVIRALARKQMNDEALIEDVIQDVLLTLHRVRHTYDPGCPFLPWLMAIAHARSVDALRRQGRFTRREVTEDEQVLNMADTALIQNAEQRESREELYGFLSQLPSRQRQIVESIHLQEMSLAEAAKESNLSIPAVKSLLHRALSNLRRYGASHGKS